MITSLGVGSGLDLQSLVDQLVSAERAPALQRLAVRESTLQARFSAFASLSSAADGLRSAATRLEELVPGRAATVSGAIEALTASASDAAPLGSYSIAVGQLAQAHALATGPFASASDPVGSGTLTITFGTTDYNPQNDKYNSFTPNPARAPVDIEIGPGAQSLADIRDAINAADAGVSAVIVGDASGERLLLSSDQTGLDNSIQIVVDDDDGNDKNQNGLSQLAFNKNATNLEQTAAAADAQLTVNGLALTSASNESVTITAGLTVDLLAPTAVGETATIKVANRTTSVRSALDEFVTAYNELVDLSAELGKYDPNSGPVGTLFGDTTMRGMMQSLRRNLSAGGAGGPGLESLIDIGLKTDDAGHLSVDSERLDAALDGDFQAVVGLINGAGESYARIADAYVGGEGLLAARSDGIQTRLDGIADQREALDLRSERLQARLSRQFASLDTLLAGLRSTSEFISAQLANLNVGRGND